MWVRANIGGSFHGQNRVPWGQFSVSMDTGQFSQPGRALFSVHQQLVRELPAIPSPVGGDRSHLVIWAIPQETYSSVGSAMGLEET